MTVITKLKNCTIQKTIDTYLIFSPANNEKKKLVNGGKIFTENTSE